MNKENFVKMCHIFEEVQFKTSKFENNMETLLDGDTTVMLIWPAELTGNMLKIVLVDLGDSESGATWFVNEGMTQIKKDGRTEIGIQEQNKTYIITSYEDYYDFVTGNVQNLLTTEGVKRDPIKKDISWKDFIKEIKKEQR